MSFAVFELGQLHVELFRGRPGIRKTHSDPLPVNTPSIHGIGEKYTGTVICTQYKGNFIVPDRSQKSGRKFERGTKYSISAYSGPMKIFHGAQVEFSIGNKRRSGAPTAIDVAVLNFRLPRAQTGPL